MKIANIIYDELVNHEKVECINYIQGNFDYKNIKNDLPTLFVGWRFMKSCNTSEEILNTDISSKIIIPNKLFWEYSFEENRSNHISGVRNFALLAPDIYYESRYEYKNIDPTYLNARTLEQFYKYLPRNIDKVYKYKNDSLYILDGSNIFGINLKLLTYIKFDMLEFYDKLKQNSPQFIDDQDGSFYMNNYRTFDNFDMLKRFIVTMITN